MLKYVFKNVLLTLSSIFILSSPLLSCSTPVFRYALEMWPAYAYVVEVIHDGNLDADQKQALTFLNNSAVSGATVNLVIEEIANDLPGDIKKEDLPIIRLSYPKEHNITGIIWQGALSNENVQKIVSSPSRNQVLNNIRRGDAAVWLFLESGNAEKDQKQLRILKEELERLSQTLKLAETATDVLGNLLDIEIINTGVNFSLVQIDRNDPMEEVFVKVLMGTEADLQFFNHIPLAFPVFGQGRVLYALAGNGIKGKNIETACSTIIGWCSCTIKDDNPGTDLLIQADWEKIIGDSSWIEPEEIPDITGLGGFIDEEINDVEDVGTIIEKNEIVAEPVEENENLARVIEEPEIKPFDVPEIVHKVKETEQVLKSTVIEQPQESSLSPLLRNSIFAVGLLLVIMLTALFFIKRR